MLPHQGWAEMPWGSPKTELRCSSQRPRHPQGEGQSHTKESLPSSLHTQGQPLNRYKDRAVLLSSVFSRPSTVQPFIRKWPEVKPQPESLVSLKTQVILTLRYVNVNHSESLWLINRQCQCCTSSCCSWSCLRPPPRTASSPPGLSMGKSNHNNTPGQKCAFRGKKTPIMSSILSGSPLRSIWHEYQS